MKATLTLFLLLLSTAFTVYAGSKSDHAKPRHGRQSHKFEVAGIDSAESVYRFFKEFRQAVAGNNRSRVAAMVAYPLTVTIRERKVAIKTSAEFTRHYNSIINRKVRRALSRQKAETLFVNQHGVMIGDGEIWFNQQPKSKLLRITAINN